MILILYLVVILILSVPILLFLTVAFGVISDLMGSPFVPSSKKQIEKILKEARLNQGDFFIELGSGDGRVLRLAAKRYKIKGLGIEIHPILVLYSSLLTKITHVEGIKFKLGNFFKEDFSKADVIFMFLLPKTIQKLTQKIKKECKRGTLIISHGFKAKDLQEYQIKKIENNPYPTYFYRI